MISETYLKLLKSEVKKLDDLTNNTYELEIILQDIVDNLKNAELEFIKRLGNLTSKETFSKSKISKLVYWNYCINILVLELLIQII